MCPSSETHVVTSWCAPTVTALTKAPSAEGHTATAAGAADDDRSRTAWVLSALADVLALSDGWDQLKCGTSPCHSPWCLQTWDGMCWNVASETRSNWQSL